MERRIGFCTAEDGVRIAYATKGAGFPVLQVPPWASHVEVDGFPPVPPDTGPFQVITYDKRGTGLSDRHLGDYSIETRMRDIEAVVAALDLQRLALIGFSEGAPLAIAYTAAHPQRVSRLVLSGGFAVGDLTPEERTTRAALTALVRADWGMGSAALTSVFFDNPVGPDEYWHRVQREGVTADDAALMWEANGRVDVRHLLPAIACPTLVIHGRNDRAVSFERGRELASAIRNARFVSDDGGHVDLARRRPAQLQFLLEDEYFSNASAPAVDLPSGTAVILFADIADSTALTERLGDAAFREKARSLDEALRKAITSNAGTAIDGKLLGDGVLATFGAAREAIACAAEMHRLAAGAQSSPPPVGEGSGEGSLLLHVGIHAGDVIRESNNVYGGAVNIASRVASEAAAGETLVSGTVRDLTRTSAGVSFEDRGDRELKGVGEPVRVFAVRSIDEPLFPRREGAGG